MQRILFASSEAAPLAKTGGLADVSASLPAALKQLRHDVRLVLPAYPQALEDLEQSEVVAQLKIGKHRLRLHQGNLPGNGVKVWLVDSPAHFDREGGLYSDDSGKDWPDNAERFTVFCKAVVKIAMNQVGLDWQPEVVHCNDWQTGLIPALLSRETARPATVFSIHNLAYQGRFPHSEFVRLKLPREFWNYGGMEYYGELSMIKGGLSYADRITTVSPTYAREIRTPSGGQGLDSLLNYRNDRLTGILNGVDYNIWNPAKDPLIAAPYSAEQPAGKSRNKAALQKRLGLPARARTPLLGLVSRFAEQKGIDLVLEAMPGLLQKSLQLILLGSGDRELERRARGLARRYPQQVVVHIGYDDELAHLIEAGCDFFLMPSRFEPCGLNQLYSLHYGTMPIVHRTGGLADTVVHTDEQTLGNGTATGFVFEHPTALGLDWAVRQALACYRKRDCLEMVISNAMRQDFSWKQSARLYLKVYRQARQDAAI